MKNKTAESLLKKHIFGRVLPHIYAFKTNSVPNSLKVGDTYRPVSVRLNEWKKYYPNLQKEYEGKAKIVKVNVDEMSDEELRELLIEYDFIY